jgi:uncharacterized protein YecT (DUF1311 family)
MKAFQQRANLIQLFVVALLAMSVGISVSTRAAGLFEPHIIEGENEAVCKMALTYYSDAYYSKSRNIKPLSADVISRPEFTTLEQFGTEGVLVKADVKIDGRDKVLVYHARLHSWRGDVFTGYLLDSEELPLLIEQVKADRQEPIKPFYPQDGEFAWTQETPFKFESVWFLDETPWAFDENDGKRNIFRLSADGSLNKVCELKIFDSFDVSSVTHSSALPFFSAYVKSMEKIMLSNGHCGTSHPEVGAQNAGRYFVSLAVLRPWSLTFEQDPQDVSKKLLHEHFDQWRYSDIWSYRERDVLDNLKSDAIIELSEYFQVSFSYSSEVAKQLASAVIQEMNINYYSLASFGNAGVDYSKYQLLVDGTLSDWNQFLGEVTNDESVTIFPEFSLIVDNPILIEKLPVKENAEKFVTSYEKDLLMVAAHMNNYDSVKYLVDHGWALDRTTKKESGVCFFEGPSRVNRSALTYAVENGSPYLINYLIRAGANSEIVDSDKNSLNFYLQQNPRFTNEEKALGLSEILKKYSLDVKIKPSYSCDGKLNRIETAICNSEGLSIYDLELRDAYKKALSITKVSEMVKKSQIKWISLRAISCNKFSIDSQLNSCIARMTRARIRYLESLVSSF